jgi:hypothetical protein
MDQSGDVFDFRPFGLRSLLVLAVHRVLESPKGETGNAQPAQ